MAAANAADPEEQSVKLLYYCRNQPSQPKRFAPSVPMGVLKGLAWVGHRQNLWPELNYVTQVLESCQASAKQAQSFAPM